MEPDWAGGHWHPMIWCLLSLPIHQFVVTKIKILRVRYKSRKILLKFEKAECLVQDIVTDDVPVAANVP